MLRGPAERSSALPMKTSSFLRRSLVGAALATSLSAASKIDLERLTPVPPDQPIPTQDFFRPRLLAQPVLNRAGTHIAAIASEGEDKHFLMVYDIKAAKVESTGFTSEKDVAGVTWLGNSRLLFTLTARKRLNLGLMAANLNRLSEIYPVQQYNTSSLISVPLREPERPLIWNRHDFEHDRDVGVIAVATDRSNLRFADLPHDYTLVRENNNRVTLRSYPTPPEPGLTYRYLADKEGQLAYAFTAHQGNLSLFRLVDKKWVRCEVDLEAIDVVDNANQPGQLLVIGPAKDGQPRPLQILDTATGALGEVVLQDAAYDFNGWIERDPATGDALGAVFEKGVPRVYWFNTEDGALQKSLDGMFPNQIVRVIGRDERHETLLLATYSDRHPTTYHWVNLAARKAGLFKASAPWIDPARMQPMQLLTFKTRDGHKLDAYLTLPAGASKEKPAPLVVLCHGGPWSRDSWGFNGEVQFLVHHGYAVLQPNYRGSTGSSGRFPAGDDYDFVKMHQDVTDAAKTTLRTGLVDPARVAIMGTSFGGYLAVSGVAHETALYRCAVTNAGVFDWALQVQAEKSDRFDLPYYGRMIKVLGDPRVETAKYEAISPLRHVAAIGVPVFVAGGKDDFVVEIEQSKRLIAELERHGIVHEQFLVSGEGHGMAFLKNEVDLYDRILAFLDRHLAPTK